MIQSNFQMALRVEVLHSYFNGNICHGLQFKPVNATGDLMKKVGAKIRYGINGFDLYINTPGALAGLFQHIENTTRQSCFEFDMVATDPVFHLFTALPWGSLGQWVYDSQDGSNTFKDGVLLLTGSQSENPSPSSFGLLRLYFDDILQSQNPQGYAPIRIQYKARSTQWQYFVVNKSALPLNAPAVVSKTAITFDAPQSVTTEDGQQALLFSSGNNLIPLSEMPNGGFDLVNHAKVIRKSLPNPDPWRMGTVKGNDRDEVSSPMYVYL